MTESPFPFGAVEEPAAFEVVDEPAADSRRNLIALGGLAAVVLAGGAFLLLGGGDDETADDVAFTPRARPAAAPVASPQAVKLPVATSVELGRNPFKALYIQPAAVVEAPAAPAAPQSGTPVTTTPVTGGGVPIVVTGPAGPPTTGGSAAPAPAPAPAEYKLVLTRVFGEGKDQSAVFTVDGVQMTAKVGSTFGPTAEIKLLSLQEGPKADQWTAVLQVGDGDPFDALTGEPVFVR